MMNLMLINETVRLIVEYNDFENIYETNENIRNRVIDWYNHTEITNSEMLAAVALHGPYDPDLRYSDFVAMREFYFPSEPIHTNNFHIHEIEMALDDEMWRRLR